MTEEVLISVTGLHTMDSAQEEEIEVTSAGKYYLKNGKHYILYDEILEGTGDIIKNRIKLSDTGMEIQKKGSVNANMVFQQGKKNTSWYGTPMGNMLAGIEVTDMDVREQENLIEVDVGYELEMNYEKVADSRIHIRIMAKDSGLFRLM